MAKTATVEQRLYWTFLGTVMVLLLVSLGITLYYSMEQHQDALDSVITSTAKFVSENEKVRKVLTEHQADPELERFLDGLISATENVNVITVCDTDSVRYYHPDKTRIGQKFVGGDESAILAGAVPYVTQGEGTLGQQRRAFFPVYSGQGRIIGFVMASVLTESITRLRQQIFLAYGLMGLLLLILAMLVARHMMRYMKKLFMGYQPEEFRSKYLERSEVLNALDEGIIAIDGAGTILLMNSSAKELLDMPEADTEGKPLLSVFPESHLMETMATGRAEHHVSMMIGSNHVITSRIPIAENGKSVGAITIFRNRTEMMQLADELAGTKYMLDALRAFNHEFMNKLHVILGYLQVGETKQAISYITNTSLISGQVVHEVVNQIHTSRLSALIIGKMMRASELGIHLLLKKDSQCRKEDLFLPMENYVTIIGNLLENAMDELNSEQYEMKEIELGLYCTPEYNIIVCEDTGEGIAENIREHLFEQGVSTKGENHGTGLALIKSITDRYHGTIALETEPGEGTCFTISFTREEAGDV